MKTSTVICTTLCFLLLVVILASFGLPSKWNAFHYDRLSKYYLGDIEDTEDFNSRFTDNFAFSVLLRGTDESTTSGHSPFQIYVGTNSNSPSCTDWTIVGAAVIKADGQRVSVPIGDENNYSRKHRERNLQDGEFTAYSLGSWESEYSIELNEELDTHTHVALVIEIFDDSGIRHLVEIEEKFYAKLKSGWFKMH